MKSTADYLAFDINVFTTHIRIRQERIAQMADDHPIRLFHRVAIEISLQTPSKASLHSVLQRSASAYDRTGIGTDVFHSCRHLDETFRIVSILSRVGHVDIQQDLLRQSNLVDAR